MIIRIREEEEEDDEEEESFRWALVHDFFNVISLVSKNTGLKMSFR